MNQWNIPENLEKEIIQRDKVCVYCGTNFTTSKQSKKQMPTWEHIVNDAKIVTIENISRCCFSCNSSKGAKELSIWLESSYCKNKNITKDTVSLVIKQALINPPKLSKE
jgi:hypothetical protein